MSIPIASPSTERRTTRIVCRIDIMEVARRVTLNFLSYLERRAVSIRTFRARALSLLTPHDVPDTYAQTQNNTTPIQVLTYALILFRTVVTCHFSTSRAERTFHLWRPQYRYLSLGLLTI